MNFEMEKTPTHQVYNLLIGLVAPRPIAWVTSMDENGRLNAAPFSAYNYLCTDPPIVGMGVMNRPGRGFLPKDTARNIRRTGEFVINVVTEDLIEKMNICSTDFPAEINELEMAGLTTAPSSVVKVPRIAQAHAALECTEFTTMEIAARASSWDAWWPCTWRTASSISLSTATAPISKPKNCTPSAA